MTRNNKNNHKIDHFYDDKKQANPSLINFRSTFTWFFLSMLVLYILYSFHIILQSNQKECSTTHLDTSTKQHIQTLNNLSSISDYHNPKESEEIEQEQNTELKHIVFGIGASSNLWNQRKEYIKLWWRPNKTRGVVWLDKPVQTETNEALPDIRISGNTSQFSYTNNQGQRSALRISRIVSETLRLGMEDVKWFVIGDDDTIFLVDNMVRLLSKYDHTQLYYIGSPSESHVQNMHFSYAMAFGGGGFAISYPLAKELEKMQDRCIQRYPALYGSDDRMHACMSEIGVPLTKEAGFHQYDVHGQLLGLLGSHPVAPLVSLHHLDVVEPIFPHVSRVNALERLFESVKQDSGSVMQQSICYDKERFWSISVSWGYVVQIIRGVVSPRELEMPTRTFLNWYKRADYTQYAFNTRPVSRNPCQKPFVYYMDLVQYDYMRKQIIGSYTRDISENPLCRWKMQSPENIESIIVLKRPDPQRWQKVKHSKAHFFASFWMLNIRKHESLNISTSHPEETVVEFYHHKRSQQCTYGWEIVEKVKLVNCKRYVVACMIVSLSPTEAIGDVIEPRMENRILELLKCNGLSTLCTSIILPSLVPKFNASNKQTTF